MTRRANEPRCWLSHEPNFGIAEAPVQRQTSFYDYGDILVNNVLEPFSQSRSRRGHLCNGSAACLQDIPFIGDPVRSCLVAVGYSAR